MLGGVLGSVLILGSYTSIISPSHLPSSPQGLKGGIATLDRNKVMKRLAEKIGKKHLSPKELEGALKESLMRLDKVMAELAHEKKVVLFNQEAVVSLNVPDYTSEVISRLQKKEDLR